MVENRIEIQISVGILGWGSRVEKTICEGGLCTWQIASTPCELVKCLRRVQSVEGRGPLTKQ